MAVKIATVADVPAGGSLSVTAPDGREIALFNVGGEICAMDNTCPHAGGPLGEGSLEGSVVTCPWHGWSFDVKTGECQNNPDVTHTCHKVTIQAGDVLID